MNEAVHANPSRFLRQDIIDKVLLKDLPSLYGISDTQEPNRFFNRAGLQRGGTRSATLIPPDLREYGPYLEMRNSVVEVALSPRLRLDFIE